MSKKGSTHKSQSRPLSDLTDVDWARLAAFIDGEGHIRVASQKRKGRDYMYVEVTVHNQDPRMILWCKEKFGGCTLREARPGVRKVHAIYRWYATCSVAHEILQKCLPYFIIKRNQAEIAIAFRDLTVNRWGVKGAPSEILDLQYAMKQELQDSRTLHYEPLVN